MAEVCYIFLINNSHTTAALLTVVQKMTLSKLPEQIDPEVISTF